MKNDDDFDILLRDPKFIGYFPPDLDTVKGK